MIGGNDPVSSEEEDCELFEYADFLDLFNAMKLLIMIL